MKVNKPYLKLFFLFFILYSCGAGWGDVMLDLGNNYHYYGEGAPGNYIFYGKKLREGTSIDKRVIKPNVENFAYNDFYVLVKQKPSLKDCAILLGSEIKTIARVFKRVDSLDLEKVPKHLHDKYLTNIKDSLFYKKIGLKITPQNTIEEQEYFEKLADSIIKKDAEYQKIFTNEINYWIIKKETNKVFGPFSKQAYLKKKKELGISESLKLDFEKDDW